MHALKEGEPRSGHADDSMDGGEGFLGREDWIATGVDILMREGVDQVKITRLADAMNVTRGSFYWHFKDRADLLDAILAYWEGRNTRAIVDAVTDKPDVTKGILSLFQAWIDHDRFDPALDSAVRAWGNADPKVGELIRKADATRIQALTEMYRRDGYDHPDCFIRARVLYFSQVGYFALDTARQETLDERQSYLEAYVRAFTGRELDPDVAAHHRSTTVFKEKQHGC